MVDEYQDTNLAQYRLVNMLYTNMKEEIPPERSLCVVGDVDQSNLFLAWCRFHNHYELSKRLQKHKTHQT